MSESDYSRIKRSLKVSRKIRAEDQKQSFIFWNQLKHVTLWVVFFLLLLLALPFMSF